MWWKLYQFILPKSLQIHNYNDWFYVKFTEITRNKNKKIWNFCWLFLFAISKEKVLRFGYVALQCWTWTSLSYWIFEFILHAKNLSVYNFVSHIYSMQLPNNHQQETACTSFACYHSYLLLFSSWFYFRSVQRQPVSI